jgi:hypothetical protein
MKLREDVARPAIGAAIVPAKRSRRRQGNPSITMP